MICGKQKNKSSTGLSCPNNMEEPPSSSTNSRRTSSTPSWTTSTTTLWTEATHPTSLKPRRLEFLLLRTLHRYRSISHLDLTLCPCVDDVTLKSLFLAWNSSLRSIDLSKLRLFSHVGLSALAVNCTCLVEIDLSNRPDLTDLAAKAIAEAVNLERLCLGRCKGITDLGIECVAVRCSRLRHVGLSWSIWVTDFGVGLIAIKCKEIRSLDLSHLLKLRTLEIQGCNRISRKGLSNIAAKCKYLETLDIKKCHKINDTGMIRLVQHSQNLKHIKLSYCSVTDWGSLHLLP